MKTLLMRKMLFVSFLCTFIFFSCNKESQEFTIEKKSNTEGKLGFKAIATVESSTTDNGIKTTLITKNHYILKQLAFSKIWSNLPESIRNEAMDEKPYLVSSENNKIKSLIFDLKNDNEKYNYRSLVLYTFKGRFLPLIIQSEKMENNLNKIIFKSLDDLEYLSYYVTNDKEIGKINISNKIPFSQITHPATAFTNCDANSYYSECGPYPEPTIYNPEPTPVEGPCVAGCFCEPGYVRAGDGSCVIVGTPIPQSACVMKTNNFTDCMLCSYEDCGKDLFCTLGCGVHFVGCSAMFAAVCAFA